MSTKRCEQCGRATAGHLPRCMYCGGSLGGSVHQRDPEEDAKIDILISKASRESDISDLGNALLDLVASEPEYPSEYSKPVPSNEYSRFAPNVESPENLLEADEDLDPLPMLSSDVLSMLPASSTEKEILKSVLTTASSYKEKRLRLHKHIDVFLEKLHSLESQCRIGWSRGVFSSALVVKGPESASQSKLMGEILGVDPYQAKLLARKTGVFVGQRSDTKPPLEIIAQRYREQLNLPAVVVCRKELLQLPDAWLVVRACSQTHYEVQPEDLWLSTDGMPTIIAERDITAEATLAVVGEIEVQRYLLKSRSGRRRRSADETHWEKVGQGRIGVIDLHAPHCILRFVEGLSDFSNLPGHIVGASKRSFRSFSSQLTIWNDQLRVLPSKLLTVSNPIIPTDAGDRFVNHAWEDWERYTRMARKLYGLAESD